MHQYLCYNVSHGPRTFHLPIAQLLGASMIEWDGYTVLLCNTYIQIHCEIARRDFSPCFKAQQLLDGTLYTMISIIKPNNSCIIYLQSLTHANIIRFVIINNYYYHTLSVSCTVVCKSILYIQCTLWRLSLCMKLHITLKVLAILISTAETGK